MRWVVILLCGIWSYASIRNLIWSYKKDNYFDDLPFLVCYYTILWGIWSVTLFIGLCIKYW